MANRGTARRARSHVLSKDCNSFGPRAIEAAVRLYGADRIVVGIDGTEFGCEWTSIESAYLSRNSRAG